MLFSVVFGRIRTQKEERRRENWAFSGSRRGIHAQFPFCRNSKKYTKITIPPFLFFFSGRVKTFDPMVCRAEKNKLPRCLTNFQIFLLCRRLYGNSYFSALFLHAALRLRSTNLSSNGMRFTKKDCILALFFLGGALLMKEKRR